MSSSENNTRILVVEDENEVRESYLDMFQFFGYQVDSACNGREGIVKVTKENYEIVVTDLNMPEMNGMEVLKRIKKLKPDIEVIVITGYATLENAVEAMKVGAFDYFTKPVDIEHVRIVLYKCVQQIKSRRENEELRNVNTKLREINELKDKFITITNHELRTPLTVIKGYLDLIDIFMEDKKDPELAEAVEVIRSSMLEMVDVVEHLHDLSYFDYGKKKISKQYIEVQKLVESVYNEMKVLFQKRGIEFHLNAQESSMAIMGDGERLKRSVRELVQNALKFTEKGGMVELSFYVKEEANKLFIRVSDSGIGIPGDKHALIFEPFYEVQDSMHHTTSKTDFMGGGIGVGLTLVKEVVSAHGGEVMVNSEPNRGSIFTLILPIET